MSETTMCAWCAPDNQRPAKGSAVKQPHRPNAKRFRSCGLPGHGYKYEPGFVALNVQTIRIETAAAVYAAHMAEQGKPSPYGRFDSTHVDAMEAALDAADSRYTRPADTTPQDVHTDPLLSMRYKAAAAEGVRSARQYIMDTNVASTPNQVLLRAAEAALSDFLNSAEALNTLKGQLTAVGVPAEDVPDLFAKLAAIGRPTISADEIRRMGNSKDQP